jgi:iron complex outermembrane receptor protein
MLIPAVASPDEDEADLEFDMLEEALLAIPEIESASKRRQSLLEAPSSVTVITSEGIEASGATNIVEILRRVPGIHVLQSTPNGYSVGMRGISELTNNWELLDRGLAVVGVW